MPQVLNLNFAPAMFSYTKKMIVKTASFKFRIKQSLTASAHILWQIPPHMKDTQPLTGSD